MRYHIWLASTALGLLMPSTFAALQPVTAQDLSNVFNFDASCNTRLAGNPSTLQTFANEAANMANAGLAMVRIAREQNNRAGQSYLQGFFKTSTTDTTELTQIQAVFQSVKNFLVNPVGASIVPPGNQQKASLFCDDSSWTVVNPNDYAVQEGGQRSFKKVKDLYREEIAAYQSRNGGQSPLIMLVPIPGTTPTQHEYIFSPQPDVPDTLPCAKPSLKGQAFLASFDETSYTTHPDQYYPFILLCPGSFTYNGGHGGTTLGSVPPVPQSADAPKQGRQVLVQVMPNSMTFLHELFHFVPYNPRTDRYSIIDALYDPERGVQTNPYQLKDCLKFSKGTAYTNAQNYVYMALGSWYTYFMKVSGKTITYAAGVAMYA